MENDLNGDPSPAPRESPETFQSLHDGHNPSGGHEAAEPFESLLDGFLDKNRSTLEGIVSDPPIFYQKYPNVDVEVASFSTPAKAVPSLLHHRLEDSRNDGTLATEIVARLREAATNHCVFLVGGKGCGKTRTLYEVLAQNFGFYFVASRVENGESKDFAAVVETLKLCYPSHNKATEFIPRRVGMDVALCALVARLAIFSKVLEIKPGISPLEWLICQTECRPRDVFRELTLFVIKQELPSAYLEEKFSALVQEAYERIDGGLAGSSGKLLFVVDEALPPLRNRFRSDIHPAKLKSLLSQAVKAFRTQKKVPTACILAGTGGELLAEAQDMESPVCSGESEQLTQEIVATTQTFEDSSSFGAFSDYVSSFLGPGDYKRLFSKYYQARAGTIASALHAYISRRTPREKALEFLEDFALTLATKGGSQLNAPNSVHDTLMILRSDRYLRSVLRDITEAFYLGGKGYCFTHNSSIKLVDLGIGVLKLGFCDSNPLEVATREAPINKDAVKWNYAVCAMGGNFPLVEGLTSESERVSHFEKYCAAYILDLFSRDEPLEKLFVQDRERSAPQGNDAAVELEQETNAGTPLMVRLGQNWTFERWLGLGRDRPTFLQTKTDNQFGPDFITILEMPKLKKEILLNIQVRQGMAADRLDSREFFAHNKQRQVLERNRENSSLLSKCWSSGWVELRLSPCKRIQHDDRPFPTDKPCIRAYIDKTNLYKIFPKLLQHLRRNFLGGNTLAKGGPFGAAADEHSVLIRTSEVEARDVNAGQQAEVGNGALQTLVTDE
ncbi:hypothetical protein SELMODRAFT_407304 [Selaginella moellendorffii]|uniref:Uncharacterized protein n=1 Tax=Selaginella moellendorffii TaxID=88036 RepID=D8R4L0_SELML|nr:hypothetical protein SELMODRAFT_407304 [Selaginella moellendorffii]